MPHPVRMRIVSGEERGVTQCAKPRTACRQVLGKFGGERHLNGLTVTPRSCRRPGVWSPCYRHFLESQTKVLFKSEGIKKKNLLRPFLMWQKYWNINILIAHLRTNTWKLKSNKEHGRDLIHYRGDHHDNFQIGRTHLWFRFYQKNNITDF